MDDVMQIIKDPTLTFNQRFTSMAKAAENSIQPISLSKQARQMVEEGIVFDMREGNAPFRPRYIVPDYDLFMRQGSEFLMLDPPTDIWEAVSALMILYHHVPSASGTPVYAGHLDRLLEPFIKDEQEAEKAIRILLTHLDRTIPDAFCHCDIGPFDTKAGRILLKLSEEMQRPVPNMSLIYNKNTSDAFALRAVQTGLVTSKPSFVNDEMYTRDWGSNYAVVSCYNVLPIGGGGFTLTRLNLKRLAEHAENTAQLLDTWLPAAVQAQCELSDKRVQFIVDEAGYFEHSFLVDEGLISRDKFVSMFGVVGLAECVNLLQKAEHAQQRFGSNEEANALGEQILDRMEALVRAYTPKYGKIRLHAQVGVDDDIAVTPGTRIPVGDEPDLPQHIAVTARMQKHFATGTGDLYPMDDTVRRNPQYVLDMIKGAFSMDTRYFSFYSSDADVIRVTGYLVKKSDVEKLRKGQAVLDNATVLGKGAMDALKILNRKQRSFYNA